MRSQDYRLYRLATWLVAPLLPLWLRLRERRGKEDSARIAERFGRASIARPKGRLAWFHAASVGEAASLLPLLAALRERFPALHLLVTTGTVTSAQLMAARLPQGALHQYVPVDSPPAVRRFIRHWRPNFAFWTESEFWPNQIEETNESQAFMGVVNARMSARSFASWGRRTAFARQLMSRFDIVFAQSEADAERLRALGAAQVLCTGNMKYDAVALPCDEQELLALQTQLAGRPRWLAASTHPGEEESVLAAQRELEQALPGLCTIVVPRHPQRGDAVAAMLAGAGKVAQRSKKQPIDADTAFYVADTLGELGLFYRLSEVAFVGGSLVARGGQNPLEPARLSCAIVCGPHTHNFADTYEEMGRARACLRAGSAGRLAAMVKLLLVSGDVRSAQQKAARSWVEAQSGATQRIADTLAPLFARGAEAS